MTSTRPVVGGGDVRRTIRSGTSSRAFHLDFRRLRSPTVKSQASARRIPSMTPGSSAAIKAS